MKLACSSPMVPGATLTDKAERLRSWGFDAMSVFLNHDQWCDNVEDEILNMESRTDVTPCEFVLTGPLYGYLMDEDTVKRAKSRATYIQAAETCARIGAVTSVEFEYKPQDPMPLFSPCKQLDAEQRAGFVQVFRDILVPVESGQAAVLLEPLNRYESSVLNNVTDCVGLLDELNHPNAGLLFDFFHLSIEESNLIDSIHRAGRWVRHVHLGDNNRLLPGRGNIDWKRCFGALKEIGYNGYVSLECSPSGDPTQTLAATASFLADLI